MARPDLGSKLHGVRGLLIAGAPLVACLVPALASGEPRSQPLALPRRVQPRAALLESPCGAEDSRA